MSTFFYSSYDSESSSDEDTLYYSDDERHSEQRQTSGKNLLITGESDDSGEETMSESEDEAPANKSAFLKKAESDDEDEESSDDEWNNSDSDSDSDAEAPKGRSYFLKKDFLKGNASDSDSDDEDEKKVVRSAKDKYLDEIADLTDTIENLSMVEEWVRIASEFDKLFKLAYRHNQYHLSIPRSYIKAISVLEDAITNESSSNSNEEGKKLNASESKSLNILKQKIKKEVKAYREEVDLYKKDPEAYEAIKDEAQLLDGEASDAEKKELVVSIENLFTIVQSIIESRGKKGIDQRENLKTLNELLQLAQSTYEKIVLLNLIISSRFELHTKEQFMPTAEWNIIFEDISKLLDVLDVDESYIITEVAPANDDITTPPPANSEGKHLIVGSVVSFVERLSDELTSHLLYLDPNSSEYISLLKDDSKFYGLIVRAQTYLTRIIPTKSYGEIEGDQLCRIIIKRLESIYYKPVQLIVLAELNAWNLLNTEDNSSIAKITSSEATDALNISQVNSLMDSLCSHLYQYSTGAASPVYRKRAALMQAYYYATSNQFFRARDILHLTHVQTTIHTSEPGVQVLFNRAIVQLGLAAFRSGLLEEAQTILNEVVTSPHTRELLGQGRIYFSNSNSNSADNGSSEKGKYVPFHMHVNIELVDAVYYISSLLFEVPLMALQAYQGSTPGAVAYANGEAQTQAQNAKKNFSRSFKRILEYTERQYFQGPAEETRDTVFEAYSHLVKFNWKTASNILCELRVWNMMPGVSVSNSQGKTGSELLNDMLVESCKIQALKTWTYVNSGTVKNYSVRKLAARFEIDESSVCNTIGGLIYREEIRGFLKFNDDGSKTVVFEKKEDGMGEIVRGLTDRVNSILERNEKLSLGGYQIMLKKK
ncbi:hypothetical protein PMKS-003409 [Pichia membranifaciens]|uniref:Eukaryotic translation initiation factor 3 subunit C N-terminal domain-containing protein n=1 Tax=Pichia membranifaciens TaxID=4926 RepID=A0A1Q2YKJ7_9ASCO|nr:hypothetical protein PMKS-003409 [Pichia membranifaciens]